MQNFHLTVRCTIILFCQETELAVACVNVDLLIEGSEERVLHDKESKKWMMVLDVKLVVGDAVG